MALTRPSPLAVKLHFSSGKKRVLFRVKVFQQTPITGYQLLPITIASWPVVVCSCRLTI